MMFLNYDHHSIERERLIAMCSCERHDDFETLARVQTQLFGQLERGIGND
jgi:hypothetical protein